MSPLWVSERKHLSEGYCESLADMFHRNKCDRVVQNRRDISQFMLILPRQEDSTDTSPMRGKYFGSCPIGPTYSTMAGHSADGKNLGVHRSVEKDRDSRYRGCDREGASIFRQRIAWY